MQKDTQCVHSGTYSDPDTKGIGGHSDICCGAVVASKALVEKISPKDSAKLL